MIISYEKENVFKRMWNNIFHKREALPMALEYTQKEITVKFEQILEYLENGFYFRNKTIETFDNNIRNVNIYFVDKNQESIENTKDTFLRTIGLLFLKKYLLYFQYFLGFYLQNIYLHF